MPLVLLEGFVVTVESTDAVGVGLFVAVFGWEVVMLELDFVAAAAVLAEVAIGYVILMLVLLARCY